MMGSFTKEELKELKSHTPKSAMRPKKFSSKQKIFTLVLAAVVVIWTWHAVAANSKFGQARDVSVVALSDGSLLVQFTLSSPTKCFIAGNGLTGPFHAGQNNFGIPDVITHDDGTTTVVIPGVPSTYRDAVWC
jgi:hypothetical protein